MRSQISKSVFLEKVIKALLSNVVAIIFVIIGNILLALTLLYRVNPAEGSIVDEAIIGTTFHLVLLITTMPAWIAGAVVGMTTFISYPLMFVSQTILYWFLGKLVQLLCKIIISPLKKNSCNA